MNTALAMAMPAAADAVRELAARDPALPDLGLVLDDERRSEALGSATTVERLRYKPGASVVAAVRDGHGELLWIVSYADPRKLRKSAHRAERSGAEAIPLSPLTLSGPAYADRLLARVVRRVFAAKAAWLGGASVIRYNPLRRLVLHDDGWALKLAAVAQAPAAAAFLASRGLPVLAPERIADDAWAYPWWGAGDLVSRGDADLAASAGAALLGIHRTPPGRLVAPVFDAARVASAAGAAVGALLPALAPRIRRLVTGIGDLRGPWVLSHGDWSEDQVLTDGEEVRIIDLDRAVLAPRELDLGCFLAGGGDPAMLDGYRTAGGSVDDQALAGWRALAHLQRAVEPFRRGSTTWPRDIERALTRAERALCGAEDRR